MVFTSLRPLIPRILNKQGSTTAERPLIGPLLQRTVVGVCIRPVRPDEIPTTVRKCRTFNKQAGQRPLVSHRTVGKIQFSQAHQLFLSPLYSHQLREQVWYTDFGIKACRKKRKAIQQTFCLHIIISLTSSTVSFSRKQLM